MTAHIQNQWKRKTATERTQIPLLGGDSGLLFVCSVCAIVSFGWLVGFVCLKCKHLKGWRNHICCQRLLTLHMPRKLWRWIRYLIDYFCICYHQSCQNRSVDKWLLVGFITGLSFQEKPPLSDNCVRMLWWQSATQRSISCTSTPSVCLPMGCAAGWCVSYCQALRVTQAVSLLLQR